MLANWPTSFSRRIDKPVYCFRDGCMMYLKSWRFLLIELLNLKRTSTPSDVNADYDGPGCSTSTPTLVLCGASISMCDEIGTGNTGIPCFDIS